jgi:hypothetical protein
MHREKASAAFGRGDPAAVVDEAVAGVVVVEPSCAT